MYRVVRNIVLLATVLLATTGCFKKVTTDTLLVIKPLVDRQQGNGSTPAVEAYGYIYYTDTEDWAIESYADAESKVITHTTTGEKLTMPDVESEPYEEEGLKSHYIAMEQTSSPALVVVVCPVERMYAYMWRNTEAENLYKTFLALTFNPTKTKEYKVGSKKGYIWTVMPPATSTTTQP